MRAMDYLDFAKIREDQGYRLIDVREPDEYEEVHVKGAENFPLSRLNGGERFAEDGRPVAIICRSGKRSASACMLLEGEGQAEFVNVEGGTLAAIDAGEEHVVRVH
ncbi:MAG: rhodanese-like domain-containing protein [Myxococcota bacterium]